MTVPGSGPLPTAQVPTVTSPEKLPPDETAQGCHVFPLARDAAISRIVYQSWDGSGDPTTRRVWNGPD